MLKLYNTLTRKKQEFKPIEKGKVGIYSCGPTVYDFIHVGNLRAFIFSDLLKRWLKFKGYKVKHIMNITDIDDKLIKKSCGNKSKLKEITEKYEDAFFSDIKKIDIEKADKYPQASKHINEMVELIKKLMKKGYAYKTSDGIYFSIKKFKNYGRLAGIKGLKAGASGRIEKDEYDKENIRDFALWKFYSEEDGEIFWETEIGKGRPGWHIECSAMSSKYLGQPFDIHTGGIDLIFPHHENEIAQSEASEGKKFVNFWIHNEHLVVEGKKMSKSLGNFYILKDLTDKNYSLNAIRYLLMSTHYRQKLNLTDESLKSSEEAIKRIQEFTANSKSEKDGGKIDELIEKAEENFVKAMDDDLNISMALSSLFSFIREANKAGAGKKSYNFIKKINRVLGLRLEEKLIIPAEIKKLVEKREKLRKEGNFKGADELREKVKRRGWYIDDTEEGAKLRKL